MDEQDRIAARPKAFRCYVLTIKDDLHPRLANARTQLDALGFEFEIIRGATPADIHKPDVYSALGNRILMKRALSDGEIACYVSHRRMWQAFLASGFEHGLFFEDDFHAADPMALEKAVHDCLASSRTWDVIKLFDYNPKRIVQQRLAGQTRLVAYKYPASGNVAYLMNRKAATSLLKRRRFCRPVDEDMAHMWEFDIRIWSVLPNPVSEISHLLGGSQIGEARILTKRKKNIGRSLWGNVLQAWKLGNSIRYWRKMSHFDIDGRMDSNGKLTEGRP